MRKFSYKIGLLTGLCLYFLRCLFILPAALISNYFALLVALFVIASGLSFLETGVNPFIVILGDLSSSKRRLNFSQAFNPFGAITGAGIGTIFIFTGYEPNTTRIETLKLEGTYDSFIKEELWRIVPPYLVLATGVLLLAIFIFITKFPTQNECPQAGDSHPSKFNFSSLFKVPHFVRAVLAQFLYVGAQVGTWSYFIQYVQDYTGRNEKLPGALLTGTLAAFAIGRFSATIFMKYIKPGKLSGIDSIINIALVFVAILFPGSVGMWSLFTTSSFMSVMFPAIFALGIKDLGSNAKIVSSLLIMSIMRGTIYPPIMGKIYQITH